MTLSVGQSIAIIAVCAACTFLERWLPWLLFGRRAVPKVVEYLGKILPMKHDKKKQWLSRSEERRGGKEGRSRWSPYH